MKGGKARSGGLAALVALGLVHPAGAGLPPDRRAAALLAAASDLVAVERAPARRVAAQAALARMGGRAVPYLVTRLGTTRSHESIEAVNALVAIGKGCLPRVHAAYPGLDAHGRRVALGLLARLPDPSSRPLLLAALEDPRMRVLAAAAAALGAQGEASLLGPLDAALARELGHDAPRPVALRGLLSAMAGLRRKAPPGSGTPGSDAPLLGLLDGPGLGIRRLAAQALAAGGPASRLRLARALGDREPPGIRAGLRALADPAGRLPVPADPGLVEALDPFLTHGEAGVRLAAARALAPHRPDLLAGRLAKETDRRVRGELVAGLWRAGRR